MYPKELTIHSDFSMHSLFIESLPYRFEQLGIRLHNDRNEVRKIQSGGVSFVVKYYRRITWANRFIYRFFCKSKARRSYENALYLQKKGIPTPFPVAYINCYQGLFLTRSYYISVYIEALSLSEVFSRVFPEKQRLVKDFARFTYRLHTLGIFHQDYHLKNILHEVESSKNQFYLIDINRMKFHSPTPRKSMRNLARLHLSFEEQSLFSKEYAFQSDVNPHRIFSGIFYYRQIKKRLNTLKRKVKSLFKIHYPHS